MTGTELQRKNMVESQVRPSDVTDRRIIRAMMDLARESFLPPEKRALAYADQDVVLSRSPLRAMLAPRTLAKLIQLAAIESGDSVLVAGAGTGYGSAVLSAMGASVVALESDKGLSGIAQAALEAAGQNGVTVVWGPLQAGWPARGPYDVILVEGAVPELPEQLAEQLKDGGRFLALTSRGGQSCATIAVKRNGKLAERTDFPATGPLLPGFERPAAFQL